MKIKRVHQTCNKDHGKQGEQLLKLGGHSASLDKTNKNAEDNVNRQIIIRWSQGHATSKSNKCKLNRYVPQQKYRLGTVSSKLLGGGGLN